MYQVDRGQYGKEKDEGHDHIGFQDHFIIVVDMDDHGSVTGERCVEHEDEQGD